MTPTILKNHSATGNNEIQQYESDNSTSLPDQVKVAVLMNRTRGPLQQHLHLNAGASPTYAEIRTTITEYQRAHTTFSRLQQNPSSAVSSKLQWRNSTNGHRSNQQRKTQVCPPWFSTETTLHELHQSETPNLRTATDDAIKAYGYKWVYMINNKNQAIVIPFYVCDVAQPILSATRLAEQGFEITLSEQPTIRHTNGFESALKQQHGLY